MESRVALGSLILLAIAILTSVIYFGRLNSLSALDDEHCVLAGRDRVEVQRGIEVEVPGQDDPVTLGLSSSDGRCVTGSSSQVYSTLSAAPTGWSVPAPWPDSAPDPYPVTITIGDTSGIVLIYETPVEGQVVALNKHSGISSYSSYVPGIDVPLGLGGLFSYLPQLLVLVFMVAAFALVFLHYYGYPDTD